MPAHTHRPLTFAGLPFAPIHRRRAGKLPDLSSLRPDEYPRERVELARRIWRERTMTEFRSIQIMARFLGELANAGDPLDVYAMALEMIEDEIRHTELCAAVAAALGAPALLPDPVALRDAPEFLAAPPAERALASAITMLGINETISAGYIADLHARCQQPAVRAVLSATIEDEDAHHVLGWQYIERSLARFPPSTLSDWRHLVKTTLAPHQQGAAAALAEVPADQQHLEAHPEPELVALGLFSSVRQALVFRKTLAEILQPRLAALKLIV